uniref:capsular polysaccharide export protein, LipB/KpsS family n=1 Tax=Algoriphagus sp. TaxID=1872435 RepID=UPI00404792C4
MLVIFKRIIGEIFFWLGLYRIKASEDLQRQLDSFCDINAGYWGHELASDGQASILVEGHLSSYGPNYLFRTALAAKSVQSRLLDNYGNIDILFDGYRHQWTNVIPVFRSFRIISFIVLGNYFLLANIIFFLKALVKIVSLKKRLRSPEDILNLHFDKIYVGDLIYDDILKWKGNATISKIDFNVYKNVARAYYYYQQYNSLFKKKSYRYYVCSHTVYSQYGLLCRIAIQYGADVIETSDIQMSHYPAYGPVAYPTYHEGIRTNILNEIKAQPFSSDIRQATLDSLEKRLNSQIKQTDVQKAYSGHVYTKLELLNELNIEGDPTVVFILAHVFSDSPHTSAGMIHLDYYKWIEETIHVIQQSKTDGVVWVVKPHPSAALYKEEGMIDRMVENANYPLLKLCPITFNTKSIIDCADALITVHGTAGLEYACFSKPVILTGKPFYSQFGFTVEPVDSQEYYQVLQNVKDLKSLTEEQIDMATHVYAVWNKSFDWFNPIITSDVLNAVWGGTEQKRDLVVAYKLLNENLKIHDPRTIKLWNYVRSITNPSLSTAP